MLRSAYRQAQQLVREWRQVQFDKALDMALCAAKKENSYKNVVSQVYINE